MKHSGPICDQISEDKCWFTISNFLTFLRILLSPALVAGIYFKYWQLTFALFIAVAFTDVLDGYIARWLDEKTNLGAFLDPIADKIFLLSVFSSLAFLDSPFFHIPTWFVFLILCRELIILLGTYFLIKTNVKVEVNPTIWGKLTTFFQIIFISWIFVCYFLGRLPCKTYYSLLGFVTFFSLLSLFQYVGLGIRYLRSEKDDKLRQ